MLSKHTQLLFGHPWAVSLGVGVCASLTSVGLAHWILPVSKVTYTMIPWIAGNLSVIGLITTSAIQEYAHSIHVKGVYINADVHNVIPKRFVRSVKDAGYTVGAAKN
jgi:hypothetical protein